MRISARPSLQSLVRLFAVVPVLAAVAVTGSATRVGPSLLGCAQASTAHHAALVAEHGHGAVITVCVAFAEDSITGDQLLSDAHNQAQLQYATADYGSTGNAVCQIDYEPAQYPPGCWTASSPYWALFVSRGGGWWTDSSLGISSQTFRDGDAAGFRYEGQSDSSVPPSPQGVCPVASSPTPAPTRTATPAVRSAATAAGPPPSRTASPASVAATTGPTAAASASADPSSGSSVTARANAAILSTNRSAPLPPASTGAWVAGALGAALLAALVIQLTRARRRRSGPRPPGV